MSSVLLLISIHPSITTVAVRTVEDVPERIYHWCRDIQLLRSRVDFFDIGL